MLFSPSIARANEAIVASVLLNEEKKEDLFIIKTDDSDFLIKSDDMKGLGLLVDGAQTTDVDGEKYVSLKSMAGVTFSFDEQDIVLKVTAPPEMFPKKTLDFTPQRQRDVYFPSDTSVFLNYGVNYFGNNNNQQRNLTVANELGFRVKDFLVFSDTSYTCTNNENRFARLMSNVTYDRRKELNRFIAGDFYASTSQIGSTLNMGGLSYAKVYRMDPYFVKYPMIDFKGVLTTPSEVEIYRNGIRIGKERLSPGEFELRDLASYGGAGVLETVIRDPFGRESHFSEPFYFTNILLKEGLREYSYNTGFLRNDFGIKSASYGSPALSAFHRYGLKNWVTVGGSAEAGRGRYNLGPQATVLLRRFGTVTTLAAASLDSSGWKKGAAGFLIYEYQGRTFNTWFSVNGYTINYLNVASAATPPRTKMQAGGGGGYTTMKFGSVSLDISDTEYYDSASRQIVGSATYSRSLGGRFFASATYRVSNENGISHEIFTGLNYYPGKGITLSGNYQRDGEGAQTGTLQVQKNPPYGEGLGYRAAIQKTENAVVLDPSAQYNSSFGIHRGEYIGSYGNGTNNSFEVSTAGAVAYVAKTLNFTRPVNDSFGLVKVAGIKDIGVYVSNQKIATTNKAGKAFIPDLTSYYDNQISIDASAVPIDYDIGQAFRFVSPPFRSGSLIDFNVTKLQAVTGILKIRTAQGVVPLEFYEITARGDGKEIVFPTGRGGEFYAEKMGPGRYTMSFDLDGRICEFEIEVPDIGQPIVDLGEIVY